MWNILALEFGSYISAHMDYLHKQPIMPTQQKIMHAWTMRFLYVILVHMVVGTTLHQ